MIRKLFPPAGLLLVLCVAAQLGAAQTIEKRVVFAKGKYSATYAHKLPSRYADYDAYVLRAKKGQTLTVKLHADDPNAYISIYEIKVLGPDEDSMIGDIEYNIHDSGQAHCRLPANTASRFTARDQLTDAPAAVIRSKYLSVDLS